MTEPLAGGGPGDGSGPERYFFVHVQKTAGTALQQRLRTQFPDEAIYPDESDGRPPNAVLVVEDLVERYRLRRDDIRVITGHFPLATTEVLRREFGDEFRTFTVLRDPVERTLSYLRHHRKLSAADRDLPLEAIYEDDFRYHGLIHNHMVKMLALTPEEMIAGVLTRVDFTPEHLERAKAALETVDVVGVQEEFEPFCDALADRFGWDLGDPLRANTTPEVEVTVVFTTVPAGELSTPAPPTVPTVRSVLS